MLIRVVVLGVAILGGSSSLCAQGKFNQKLTIGQTAPAWSDLPGTDGAKHSLADLKDKDVVVMVITCNHCTIAVRYEDRILEFVKQFADKKVALVAINVNHRPADRLPKMQERAQKKGFTFPYLFDESQAVGLAYGATVTPEFFVLDRQRKLVYMGAMDDSTDPQMVTKNYLRDAVEAVLQGKAPPLAESKGRGCAVEYESK
jgi:peroxiredoxin